MYHERQDLEDSIEKWARRANFARKDAAICRTAAKWYFLIMCGTAWLAPDNAKITAILPAVACYNDFREMKKYQEKQARFQHRADYRKNIIESTWKDNSSNL